MELTFLGRGAGFFPAEDSTSAYFLDNGELFLIDSGESVFKTLLDKKILDSASALNIFITHTHSDHVGSLGSLLLYASVAKKFKTNIISDENTAYIPQISALLKIYGVTERMYQFVNSSSFNNRYSQFSKVRYIKTYHCDELETCGIMFETSGGLVFYSGDMKDPAPLVEIVRSGKKIDKIYIDSNDDPNPNPYHLRLKEIYDIVPPELRPNVYCMHFNSSQCMEDALSCGFKVVNK
ncbi:MAG: MBL fold metallo-hydrolase [Treponema sp.]|jgi:L-ascorbate metabolism protein UlaG (beta-lactamase superfamily)|nr:MBL fold metallo-hydrolase [Treponema sp.]